MLVKKLQFNRRLVQLNQKIRLFRRGKKVKEIYDEIRKIKSEFVKQKTL